MDMGWQEMLHEAATISFTKKQNTIVAEAENVDCCIDLQNKKIRELSEKILLLPHEGVALLFARYCFALSWTGIENLLQLQNAKEDFAFYRQLLSHSVGLDDEQIVSDLSFQRACHKALKKYVRMELRNDAEVERSGKRQVYRTLRKMGRAVAIVLVTSVLLFSGTMVTNAKFREKVVTWVIETFDDFCTFQVQQKDDHVEKELSDYQISYVPKNAKLQSVSEQPRLIAYEYVMNDDDLLSILICKDDTIVYMGAENAKMHPVELDGATGYLMNEGDTNYICFERDGNFFAACGVVDENELIKIANGIMSE